MSISKGPSKLQPVNGLNSAFYADKQNVVFCSQNYIRHLNMDDDFVTVKTITLGGPVKTCCISADYSVFAIALEEETNEKIVVYNCSNYEEKFVISIRHPCVELAISQGGETMACLSVLEERVNLVTFDLTEGLQSCNGDILIEPIPTDWRVSFCPADDGVMCALGGKTAYLLRGSNGYIENFSFITFVDVLSHAWSNDVTMAFGTSDGQIRLYRETIALEIIDLKESQKSLLESSPCNGVLHMVSSLRLFGVLLENGILMVFSSDSNGPQWNQCKAIVMSEWKASPRQFLSFDVNDEFVLYSDGNQLLASCLRYAGSVSKDGGRCIAAGHSAPVVLVQISTSWVVSLDSTGLFIFTSRHTGRHILQERMQNVLYFSIIDGSSEILVVTRNGMEKYLVTNAGFELEHIMLDKKILMCCDSADSACLAIIEKSRLMIMRIIDQTVILDEMVTSKKEIKRAMFSADCKYLVMLTKNDHVFAVDVASGKTLWSMDYKLHFFTDMAYASGIVYLLDQKFVVTRVKHGKELPTMNLHAAEVGYTCSSKLISASEQLIITTTENGSIIVTRLDNVDEPFLIKPVIGVNVSFRLKSIIIPEKGNYIWTTLDNVDDPFLITPVRIAKEHLLLGYEDGRVSLLNLSKEEQEQSRDWVLCDHSTVQNLNHLIRDLDNERNCIRTETESLVKTFTETRDRELAQIKEDYASNMNAMKERVKRFEDGYEAAEAEKTKLIAHLQSLYKEEARLQETKYERIMNEQIKKTLKLQEDHLIECRDKEAKIELMKAELIASFHMTEKRYILDKEKLNADIIDLNNQLDSMRDIVNQSEISQESVAMKYKKQLEEYQVRRRQDADMLENEIWTMRATLIQLTEQRDQAQNDVLTERTAFIIAKQEMLNEKEEVNRLQDIIKQLKAAQLLTERKDIDKNKMYQKLQKNCSVKEKELEESKAKGHRATRRCLELEARIDKLGECVYDSRKLQHATLSLISFMQNIEAEERFKLT